MSIPQPQDKGLDLAKGPGSLQCPRSQGPREMALTASSCSCAWVPTISST